MIAKHKLYLTQDKRRVVHKGSSDAAYLLAGQGQQIPSEYTALVEKLYGPKPEPKPVVKPDEAPDAETLIEPAEPIETRETKVPKFLRKRGRPRKSETQDE